MFDCIVIGGSLSGSSLALLLGRAGFRVLLTEKGTFPKSKPCGEGLSSTGLKIAQHFRILPQDKLPFHAFSGFNLYSGRYRATISHPYSSGISVERSQLDSYLWDAVSNTPGVETRERCRVTNLLKTDPLKGAESFFQVTLDGERTPLHAKAVVVATGGTSTILSKVSEVIQEPRSFRVGMSSHFTGAISPLMGKVHIFLGKKIEFYVTPLSENKVNIAVLTESTQSNQLKDLLLQASNEVEARFGILLKEERKHAAQGRTHLGNVLRSGEESGVFLIGDAIEQFDPIGGMGMTHAFFSAGLASCYLTKGLLGQLSITEVLAQYEQSRIPFAKQLKNFTQFTASAMKIIARYPPSAYLASSTFGNYIAATIAPKYYMSGIDKLMA